MKKEWYPWKQVRLAGSIVVIVGYFYGGQIMMYGLIVVAIGTVNGVLSLEGRVEELEKKLYKEEETNEPI